MSSTNPYKTTRHCLDQIAQPRINRRRWALASFAIVFLACVGFGGYGLYVDAQYAATLPSNVPRCGNPAMAAMAFIFPIGPVFGSVAAGMGYLAAAVLDPRP
ncbi:hypothetical protein [Rhodopirellula bahusiensis]|nr:hypothetical protein [Rhodopirellula bahusiensis]